MQDATIDDSSMLGRKTRQETSTWDGARLSHILFMGGKPTLNLHSSLVITEITKKRQSKPADLIALSCDADRITPAGNSPTDSITNRSTACGLDTVKINLTVRLKSSISQS